MCFLLFILRSADRSQLSGDKSLRSQITDEPGVCLSLSVTISHEKEHFHNLHFLKVRLYERHVLTLVGKKVKHRLFLTQNKFSYTSCFQKHIRCIFTILHVSSIEFIGCCGLRMTTFSKTLGNIFHSEVKSIYNLKSRDVIGCSPQDTKIK